MKLVASIMLARLSAEVSSKSGQCVTFEEEARFRMQNCVRLPIAFWLFTDPTVQCHVGPCFLSKVLQVVEPDWELDNGLHWAASAQQRAEIDAFFTLDWHKDFLSELEGLAISKCREKAGLISEYDFKVDLQRFWGEHSLGELKVEWLLIARGGLPGAGFDVGCGLDRVFNFALRHGIVHPHRNGATKACMRKILIYGDKSTEYELLMVSSVLEGQRVARRSSKLRGGGAKKAAGKPPVNDLSSKRQQRTYLEQQCESAHSFTKEESGPVLH